VTALQAPTVAIFNSASDVIQILTDALEADGCTVFAARISEIQDGTLDLVSFIHEHNPAVIVYDLPAPLERHWNFLRLLRETDSLKSRCWVLTTTDKVAAEILATPPDVVEIIIGQPRNPTDVTAAVRACLDLVRR
jgi:DNA-binding NarL/FixJ family response regulator